MQSKWIPTEIDDDNNLWGLNAEDDSKENMLQDEGRTPKFLHLKRRLRRRTQQEQILTRVNWDIKKMSTVNNWSTAGHRLQHQYLDQV